MASLATVVSLAGAPSVLSACVALCLPGGTATAATHGAHTSPRLARPVGEPAVAGDHHHHAMPMADAGDQAFSDPATLMPPAERHVGAPCRDCCQTATTAAAIVTAGRLVTLVPDGAVTATVRSWHAAQGLVTSAAGPGRGVSPPSPPRAPAVLRI